ncbi:MAG: DUF4139 domain-containing protein [Sphingomonadaceae bacterium]
MRRLIRMLLSLLLASYASALAAEPTIITSAKPEKLGVTIYRAPDRRPDSAMQLDDLQGFALITETRTVDLPPGIVTIRFEGVASGIIPQSAIIFGSDVREKNRDAALLSQRGLIDAFTGQSVTLKRTDPATGKVTSEAAVIRSQPDRLIVQTAQGFEAMYCSGLDQTLIYGGVPKTLSATPVLSMTTHDQPGGKQTITLAYLSSRFDWDATYVAELSEDSSEISLFAWLTMASADDTSFPQAQAGAIAGKLNRSENTVEPTVPEDQDIQYQCWPSATTLSVELPPFAAAPVSLQLRGKFADAAESVQEIVVTGSKRAELEAIGDLKYYRIPFPTTVAARAQKQVAFLSKPKVKGKIIYRSRIYGEDASDMEMLFRFKNDKGSGLGEPLPTGKVAVFQQTSGRRMLVGETQIADKTVNEEVDFVFGEASNVTIESEDAKTSGDNWNDRMLTVRNANPVAVNVEVEFSNDQRDRRISGVSKRLVARPGKQVWVVTVPANGSSVFRYRDTEVEEPE